MKDKSVESHVMALLETSFPGAPRPLTRASEFVADLDADSMAMVSLIFAIDEEFGIGTDQLGEMVVDCRTVGDLIAAVERLRRERAA